MNHAPTTILVVDDDPGVQRLAAQILRTEGYNVLVASDTPDAMKVSDQYSEGIDLLLTDIMLPSGNGISLASALLAKRPDAQVLYMSGFTADAIQAVQHEAGPNGGFLEKPFLPRTLVDRVRMVVPANERQVPIPDQPEPVVAPTAVATDLVTGANSDAVYRLESPARCPQCGETISTLRAVRLLRTQVNFTSTLPRRGRIITCPNCFSIVPAELTNF